MLPQSSRPCAADDFATIRARMEELRPATRPRAADDFAMIRARLEELRRERAQVVTESELRLAPGPRLHSVGGRPMPAGKLISG